MRGPTMTTTTIPQPPTWVHQLDHEGHGTGPAFSFASHTWDTEPGILLEWSPIDGPLVYINEDRYTVAEARVLNARRLTLLAALAAAGVEDVPEVRLPDWDDTVLTFHEALDVVTVTAQALAIVAAGEVRA